jgi:hypothetical protein
MTMIAVIGRGHSGTRILSHTLRASGVDMGSKLNESGDLVPADALYEACRVMARHVIYLGNQRWDFRKLHTVPLDPAFTRLIESYLASVLASEAEHKGWKLPETTLVYPWIVRLFPEIRYIHWVRDPRDCILGRHLTDDLADFGVPCDRFEDVLMRRALSWKYQAQIVQATPPPSHFLTMSFESFVLQQDQALARLREFLGIPLVKVEVHPQAVGRWRRFPLVDRLDLLREDLIAYGYAQPSDFDPTPDTGRRETGEGQLDHSMGSDCTERLLLRAMQEILERVNADQHLILIDEEQLRSEITAYRRVVPFLEKDGQYWGPPPDDETAIRELERLRREGAEFVAFTWPAFWWLDYYAGFHQYLREKFRCILHNDSLLVFDLRR